MSLFTASVSRRSFVAGLGILAATAATFSLSSLAFAKEIPAPDGDNVIRIAATPTPHAEILNDAVKPLLEEKGWQLDVIEFTDYVLPNTATEEGEVDANYFQHQPYLDSFNEEKGTHLVSVAKVHFEPFGLYAGRTSSLAELKEGALVAVPNDTTNEARALLLLQQEGLLTLKEGAGITATPLDIAENPLKLQFQELAAEAIPQILPDVDIAAINGNYAINAGLKVEDALAVEATNSLAADTYGNVIVVRESDKDSLKAQALVAAVLSEEVRAYIAANYAGAVVATFAKEIPAPDGDNVIRIAATPTPHAEILNDAVKPLLEEKGWQLDVIEFTDYVLPNTATEEGEVDANYFQHQPYLDSFNEEKGTHLVSVAKVHFEPFGLYAGRTSSLAELKEGALVAVPNDTTNEARALLLLQQEGLLTLKEGAGITATPLDIAENPLKLQFQELAAEAIPQILPDVDIAAINGNYAINAGLKVEDALAVEASDSLAAETYGNVIVVREADKDSLKAQALTAAILTPEVKDYIAANYAGAVLATF